MQEIFVVTEAGFEYDDSYYHKSEFNYGSPKESFSSLELAQKYCDEKSFEFFKKNILKDFSAYVEGMDQETIESIFGEDTVRNFIKTGRSNFIKTGRSEYFDFYRFIDSICEKEISYETMKKMYEGYVDYAGEIYTVHKIKFNHELS